MQIHGPRATTSKTGKKELWATETWVMCKDETTAQSKQGPCSPAWLWRGLMLGPQLASPHWSAPRFFEGRDAFWDPFVTPNRKSAPLGDMPEFQSCEPMRCLSVCVFSSPTSWRTEGIYFKSQKRCFEQLHLAKFWHWYPREKLNAAGQTSFFWLKCSIKTHLILVPGCGEELRAWGSRQRAAGQQCLCRGCASNIKRVLSKRQPSQGGSQG